MRLFSSAGVFLRQEPAQSAPVVFDIPRSGAEYPRWYLSQAPLASVQSSISAYVEELYSNVTQARAHWLYARFPNVVIDPNRHEEDMLPEQIQGQWATKLNPSEKCSAGIGLIPMIAGGQNLYTGPLSVGDVERRLNELYRPYHVELGSLLKNAKIAHGRAFHLSCHSMASVNPPGSKDAGQRRSDFDLGNRNGQTCSAEFIDFVASCLREFGYNVTLNKHFIGAEVVRKHAAPQDNIHSLQIEMNRDLYMNEKIREKKSEFEQVKSHMTALATRIVSYAEAKV